MCQRNRLILNVLTNYGTFIIFGAANFFLAGYTIRRLGKDAFGIVALVMSLTIVTEFLGRGICQALTKYVASEVSKRDFDMVNRFINMSLAWLSGCGLIGLAICGCLAYYIDELFNIPPLLVREAQLVMFLMGLRVLLCFPFNTFQSILWAYQRYDLANLAKSITIILRVLLVVAYFELVSAGVTELVVITIVTLIIERIFWVVLSLRIAQNLRFGLSFWSAKALSILASFGGLILVIYVGNMIGYEAVKWVIGSELTVADVGGYSLIAYMATTAATLTLSISQVLMPVASKYSALGQHNTNAKLALRATKYVMIITSAACLVPLMLLKPLLTLWIGDEYTPEYISQLGKCGIILLVGQWLIATASCQLQMMSGVGYIRVPAVTVISWAICGVGSIWMYLHWGNGSLFGAVVIITIARIIGSTIHFFYGSHVLQIPRGQMLWESILRPGIAGLATVIIGYFLLGYLNGYELGSFILIVIMLIIVYCLFIWVIALSGSERMGMISSTRSLLRKSFSTNNEKV